MASFEHQLLQAVSQLLSPDNTIRPAAEKFYEDSKRDQPAATIAVLFKVVQERQVEQPVREQACVLLRQCISKVKDSGSTWSALAPSAHADVRSRLLAVMEEEASAPVRRKVADCVQSLGNQLIDIGSDQRPKNAQEWPELMPTLMRLIVDRTKDRGIRADCLWTVKEMTCSVWQILVASAGQALQVMQVCLSDPDEQVRAEAAALLCSLVDNIESREERKPFAPLIPEVGSVIAQLARSAEAKHLNSVLQSLTSTTETADFFRAHISSMLLPVLSDISRSHTNEAARKYAFEVILTFMESKPKTMFKTPGFAEQAVEVCVHFLMKLDDDLESWAAEDHEEADDEEEFLFGKEAMDRISRCAQKVDAFPHVLEVLKPAITKLFQTGQWKQVVAGTAILAQIAEFVDDEATVVNMMTGIKSQLAASHARVRYVAWSAIAQFAEDHSEVVTTDSWAAQLLPEFLKGLEDPCQRTAVRCMEAFQHYGESVEREDLEPYVQPFMTKLGLLLQGGQQLLQKKAITFIAVIAGQVDDAFAPYYEPLMPVLKKIIQNTLHKVEERSLLGKCFECISLLARAVGAEVFKPDAEAIMQAMIQATQQPNLPNNDPVKEYTMAASERICSTLKEGFLPFVPHILPGVLQKFMLAPKEFSGATEDIDENGEVNLTLMEEGGKVKIMIMYSSEIQDLRSALECVHTFVAELGKGFTPFVVQTAEALLPVFDFNMSEDIRDLAFETWSQLCACARSGGEAAIVSKLVMEFLARTLPKLEESKTDVEALKTRADGVRSTLKSAGPGVLTPEQVKHICQTSMKLLMESFQRRQASQQVPQKPREDDEEEEEDDDDEEVEEALRIAMQEITGAVMEHHPDAFTSECLSNWQPLVQQLATSGGSEGDRKLALFIICDFVEFLGARASSSWQAFLPILLEDLYHKAPELRQPAAYGLSLAAKDPAFGSVAVQAAERLTQVIRDGRSRSKKKSEKISQAVVDNALSALVNILLHHGAALGAAQAQLWTLWLQSLPCQHDEEEAVKNHKLLLSLIQQERPEVVGEGGVNVPKVLSVLVEVYKTDLADEETSKGIGQMVLRLGEARLQSLSGHLSEKLKKKVLRILKEAQRS